jgi:hypothetical protein
VRRLRLEMAARAGYGGAAATGSVGAAVAAGVPEVRRRQSLGMRRWRWCRGYGV